MIKHSIRLYIYIQLLDSIFNLNFILNTLNSEDKIESMKSHFYNRFLIRFNIYLNKAKDNKMIS